MEEDEENLELTEETLKMIEERLQQIKEGKVLSTDEVKERLKKRWLRSQMIQVLTRGWSPHERKYGWGRYLAQEIRPHWPTLFEFLKEGDADEIN